MQNDYLEHYGVKGMKWRHRKSGLRSTIDRQELMKKAHSDAAGSNIASGMSSGIGTSNVRKVQRSLGSGTGKAIRSNTTRHILSKHGSLPMYNSALAKSRTTGKSVMNRLKQNNKLSTKIKRVVSGAKSILKKLLS